MQCRSLNTVFSADFEAFRMAVSQELSYIGIVSLLYADGLTISSLNLNSNSRNAPLVNNSMSHWDKDWELCKRDMHLRRECSFAK
jgi:hypothetical protein